MGKLDEFFKPLRREKGTSEIEVLEEIEGYLSSGEVFPAVEAINHLEKEANVYLALRMVLRTILRRLRENPPQEEVGKLYGTVKELIPLINGIFNSRFKALLLADLAVILYSIDDELNADIALRTAINLAGGEGDLLRDILRELIYSGLLDKAGYAMKMVRDRGKLDVVLSELAEMFYRAGDVKRATAILKHISSPFHRAITLANISEIEARRDRKKALELLDAAMRLAESINDDETRVELGIKLYSIRQEVEGKGFSLRKILARKEAPQE
ncbi:hypothetical protein [Thermococcus sp.]|uniref:hypothetical protein n=1 Tax=Thermococcus sp. TaxID=35749 RepID=UPI0025CCC7A3|nr:hypothetical protein [Thermococcus sp.]